MWHHDRSFAAETATKDFCLPVVDPSASGGPPTLPVVDPPAAQLLAAWGASLLAAPWAVYQTCIATGLACILACALNSEPGLQDTLTFHKHIVWAIQCEAVCNL